jgi:hypothetical protein
VTAAIVTAGGSRYGTTLSRSEVGLASILTLVGLTMGAFSFTLAKVAVVMLLVKLLSPPQWQVRVLWVLVGGNILFMGIAGLVFFLQCMPPQALWDQEFEIEQSCWNPMIATGLAIAASGKTDFCLSSFPAMVFY